MEQNEKAGRIAHPKNTRPVWVTSPFHSLVLTANGFFLQGTGDSPLLRGSLGLQTWAWPPSLTWGEACWVSATESLAFDIHPRFPMVSGGNKRMKKPPLNGGPQHTSLLHTESTLIARHGGAKTGQLEV